MRMIPSQDEHLSLRQSCTCEQVARFEIDHYANDPDVIRLTDLMRRTRSGMGYCQGTSCLWEMMAAISARSDIDVEKAFHDFIAERQKNQMLVLSGDQLRQEVFRAHVHSSVTRKEGRD